MRLALILFVTLYPLIQLFAQQDSLSALRVYKSLLQEQTLPALVADNGKHVFQVNTVYQVNSIRTVEQPFQTFQATYRTQWRKHGFGIIYEGIPGSSIWSNSVGLQYGYGIGFKKYWLRHTKVSLGTGAHFTKVNCDFSKMTFSDQIHYQFGFIRPSEEIPITNSIFYPRFEAGLFIRSHKLFLGMNVDNINEPSRGSYQSSPSKLALKLIINTGVKLIQWEKISSWLTYEQQNSDNVYSEKLGLTLAFKNRYLLTCFQRRFDGPHFRFAYTTNRIRAFLQYQKFDNDYTGYFGYGNVYAGMAYAIGKQ